MENIIKMILLSVEVVILGNKWLEISCDKLKLPGVVLSRLFTPINTPPPLSVLLILSV